MLVYHPYTPVYYCTYCYTYLVGKIIAAEPYTPSTGHSLTDRLAAMGNALPISASADPRQSKPSSSQSYNPAEQLQREKTSNAASNEAEVEAEAEVGLCYGYDYPRQTM